MGELESGESRLDNIGFHFNLATAGDVVYMIIAASRKAQGRGDHYVHSVLTAQADMIREELHVRDPFPDMMGDIVAFHEKFGLTYTGKPRSLKSEVTPDGKTLYDFRLDFMREEVNEYEDEQVRLDHDLERHDDQGVAKRLGQQLDALVDEVYVVLGTAYLQFGAAVFNEAWRRVHHANMQKVRAQKVTDSKRDSTFDVVKPAGWQAPNHIDLVTDHAHVIYRHPGPETFQVLTAQEVANAPASDTRQI